MKKFLFVLAAVAFAAFSGDAQAFGRRRCCGATATPTVQTVQYAPQCSTIPASGPVRQVVGGFVQGVGETVVTTGGLIQHATIYHPPAAPATGPLGYTPIRLSAPLPTCVNGNCGK